MKNGFSPDGGSRLLPEVPASLCVLCVLCGELLLLAFKPSVAACRAGHGGLYKFHYGHAAAAATG